MTSISTATESAEPTVTLAPSFRIPIAIAGFAIPVLFLNLWVGGAIALFGLFLLYQSATLRLTFTPTALEIYRGDTQIRDFPYVEWQTWEIFWSPVPILFYFREVNSIHFLPILFQPTQLRSQLEQRVPLGDSSAA